MFVTSRTRRRARRFQRRLQAELTRFKGRRIDDLLRSEIVAVTSRVLDRWGRLVS